MLLQNLFYLCFTLCFKLHFNLYFNLQCPPREMDQSENYSLKRCFMALRSPYLETHQVWDF